MGVLVAFTGRDSRGGPTFDSMGMATDAVLRSCYALLLEFPGRPVPVDRLRSVTRLSDGIFDRALSNLVEQGTLDIQLLAPRGRTRWAVQVVARIEERVLGS